MLFFCLLYSDGLVLNSTAPPFQNVLDEQAGLAVVGTALLCAPSREGREEMDGEEKEKARKREPEPPRNVSYSRKKRAWKMRN